MTNGEKINPSPEGKEGLPRSEYTPGIKYVPGSPKRGHDDFIEALMEEFPSEIDKNTKPLEIPFISAETGEGKKLAEEARIEALLEGVTRNLRAIFGTESEVELPITVEGNSLSLQSGAERVREILSTLRNHPIGKGYRITVEDQTHQYVLFNILFEGKPISVLRLSTDGNTGFLNLEGQADNMPEAAGLIRRLVEKADSKRKNR